MPLTVSPAHVNHWVKAIWPKTHWGYAQVDIKPDVDQGWVHYMTKQAKRDCPGIGWNMKSEAPK